MKVTTMVAAVLTAAVLTVAVADADADAISASLHMTTCEFEGVRFPHRSTRYLVGHAHRRGSIYGTCEHGHLSCFEDSGLADAPRSTHTKVDCDSHMINARRRKLGVAINHAEDKWPNGLVWYRFSTKDPLAESERALVRQAIKTYEATDVGIAFQECEPVSLCKNLHIDIAQKEDACYSYVGYTGESGGQIMNLGTSCFEDPGTVVHELGHALGLYHEHTHPQREVIILTDSNLPVSASNYAKETDGLLRPYDKASIMHYGRSAGLCLPKEEYALTSFCDVEITTNCVMPKKIHCNNTRNTEIGQRKQLSPGDVNTLKALYGTQKPTLPPTQAPSSASPAPSLSPSPTTAIPSPRPTTAAPTPPTTTQTPRPTTETPRPTTEKPRPTTETPRPTTETPRPTTEAPRPTTETPRPTTEIPRPTTETPRPTTQPPNPTSPPPSPSTVPPTPPPPTTVAPTPIPPPTVAPTPSPTTESPSTTSPPPATSTPPPSVPIPTTEEPSPTPSDSPQTPRPARTPRPSRSPRPTTTPRPPRTPTPPPRTNEPATLAPTPTPTPSASDESLVPTFTPPVTTTPTEAPTPSPTPCTPTPADQLHPKTTRPAPWSRPRPTAAPPKTAHPKPTDYVPGSVVPSENNKNQGWWNWWKTSKWNKRRADLPWANGNGRWYKQTHDVASDNGRSDDKHKKNTDHRKATPAPPTGNKGKSNRHGAKQTSYSFRGRHGS